MNSKDFILFCFPYAGGTVDFYNNIEEACGDRIKFVKLEYSGHGTRMREPLYSNFDEMTADIYPQIIKVLEEYPNMEYSMMGYSMGSIAVFDMLMKIKKERLIRNPWHVFLSAHLPQPIESLRKMSSDKIDDWVKERTIELGGLDKRLIDNTVFWRLYLPIFRADYLMISNYDFESINFITDTPVTIFYSEKDTPFAELKEWKKFFVGACDFTEYSGSHFFIDNHYKEMSDVIRHKYESHIIENNQGINRLINEE